VSTFARVRPAVLPVDLDAIMAIDQQSFTNPWSREMFEWESANSDVARVFVAELADRAIVAYCATWLIFDELHINTLAVDPAWRRQGLARQLLLTVFALAAQEGARRATLEVRSENAEALGLYQGLGFHVSGVRRGYYQRPPDDALILWSESLEPSVPPA
jgi:ribosomal-protein-alanine N-acetyltransferase